MLQRLLGVLEADHRVVACWLGGSLGRGTADRLSDVDLHTVVDDGALLEWWDGRAETLAAAGRVLLSGPPIVPGSSELDRFQGVVFEGGYVLDWTVTALSQAERDLDTTMVFERSRIPVHVVDAAPNQVDERLRRGIWSFWWMATVALKQSERGATDRAVTAIDFLRFEAGKIWRLLHDPTRADEPGVHWLHPTHDEELRRLLPTFGPVISPAECLRVTREVMALVEGLHPLLVERGVPVPDKVATELGSVVPTLEDGDLLARHGEAGVDD